MVHYKFYYFPARARGEAIRQLFHLSGVKFEEKTISMEEWPQYKERMPLGQLPVLEVDGEMIAESTAILRFLGHQFHRAGRNPIECAKLDMLAEQIQTFSNEIVEWNKVLFGMIQTDKEQYFLDKVVPVVDKYAPLIERVLAQNGNGLLIGDTETWVDVFAAENFARIRDFGSPTALAGYPRIEELIARIHRNPAVRRHIETRGPAPC